MSALEYAHWEALAGIEPIGLERGDYHAAQVTSTLAEINRNTKARSKPFALEDFLLFHDRPVTDGEDVEQQIFAVFPMPAAGDE